MAMAMAAPPAGDLGYVPVARPPAKKKNWGGRTRTSNFRINSAAVCQLTYTPVELSPSRLSGWRSKSNQGIQRCAFRLRDRA